MKTITYRGEQYEVEYWVNWVAMDLDGDIFAFENKPEKDDIGEWINNKGGQVSRIDYIDNGWSESLEKI